MIEISKNLFFIPTKNNGWILRKFNKDGLIVSEETDEGIVTRYQYNKGVCSIKRISLFN